VIDKKAIKTARGNFAYRISGNGEAVCMIHGWPESSYCWEGVLNYLGSLPFQFICPDLRGLGDSERSSELKAYLKQELSLDVLSILDDLKIEYFHLIGHDWGGIIAQEIAFQFPERVKSLSLLNISVLPNVQGINLAQEKLRASGGRSLWYQTFMQIPGLAEAMIPEKEEPWLRTFLQSPVPGISFPEDSIAEYVRCLKIENSACTSSNYYRSLGGDMKRWAQFAGHIFRMPSMYIYGQYDPVVIPEYLVGIENCFTQLRIHRLDAGHFVQEEQAEQVALAIKNFLNSVP
jgi:haloacetate dehalogenase